MNHAKCARDVRNVPEMTRRQRDESNVNHRNAIDVPLLPMQQ